MLHVSFYKCYLYTSILSYIYKAAKNLLICFKNKIKKKKGKKTKKKKKIERMALCERKLHNILNNLCIIQDRIHVNSKKRKTSSLSQIKAAANRYGMFEQRRNRLNVKKDLMVFVSIEYPDQPAHRLNLVSVPCPRKKTPVFSATTDWIALMQRLI